MFKAELLQNISKENGIFINGGQLALFNKYYNSLMEGNKKCNLTSITDPDEVVIKHFFDSLTCLKVIKIPPGAKVVDVGTGAGFPGLPIKIVRPDIELVLIDSLAKRVAFLNNAVEYMGLGNVKVIHIRAEDYGRSKQGREKHDLAISRAVSRVSVLSELCLPLLRTGGIMLAMKGPAVLEEMAEATKAIEILGGGEVKLIEMKLPLSNDGRYIIVIKKIARTPEQYPRRAGLPAQKPIL